MNNKLILTSNLILQSPLDSPLGIPYYVLALPNNSDISGKILVIQGSTSSYTLSLQSSHNGNIDLDPTLNSSTILSYIISDTGIYWYSSYSNPNNNTQLNIRFDDILNSLNTKQNQLGYTASNDNDVMHLSPGPDQTTYRNTGFTGYVQFQGGTYFTKIAGSKWFAIGNNNFIDLGDNSGSDILLKSLSGKIGLLSKNGSTTDTISFLAGSINRSSDNKNVIWQGDLDNIISSKSNDVNVIHNNNIEESKPGKMNFGVVTSSNGSTVGSWSGSNWFGGFGFLSLGNPSNITVNASFDIVVNNTSTPLTYRFQNTGISRTSDGLKVLFQGDGYKMVLTHADMINSGTPSIMTNYKVSIDETRGSTSSLYQWWPDGERRYIPSSID